ncbi:MAG: GAF domain-containing protein [Anaerolineales bacterium]
MDNPRTSAAVAAQPAARPTPRGRGGLARSLLAVVLPLSLLPLALFVVLLFGQVDRNTAIALAFGAMVITLISLVFIIRRLTVPLQSLTEAAMGMAGGDLATPIAVNRVDEVGLLAESFNRLSAELRTVYENLDNRVEARTQQLSTAAEIGRAATSILTAEDLLARSAELIRDRFGYDHVLIYLLDDGAQAVVLSEAAGPAADALKASALHYPLDSTSLIGWVSSNRQPHAARRVAGDELFTANDLLPETRSEAGLPLRVGDRLIGALAVHSRAPGAFDASELEVLQALADQISVALENGRLFTRQERVARLEQQVAAVTTRIHASLTLDAILENAAADLGRVFGASKVVVRLNPEAEALLVGPVARPTNGNGHAPAANGNGNGNGHPPADAEAGPA